MPAARREHVRPLLEDSFVEETLAQELGHLTRHLASCVRTWHRASQALRTDNAMAQSRALDELISLMEMKTW